jgi:quercetin dioxygenase-like cupin family protein
MVDSIVPMVAVATGVEFRRSPDGTFFDWHPSPSRMYMVCLAGQAEFSTADGEKRLFGPGDVLLAEDVTGDGHTTRCVGEWVRITVVIPWDD